MPQTPGLSSADLDRLTARLTSVTYIRSEIRRLHREQEASMQTALNQESSEVWPEIAPLLDAAMADLNATDRNAVVLRYFDGRSLKEVGAPPPHRALLPQGEGETFGSVGAKNGGREHVGDCSEPCSPSVMLRELNNDVTTRHTQVDEA